MVNYVQDSPRFFPRGSVIHLAGSLKSGAVRPAVCILAGVLLTLAFPKFEYWPLIFIGLVPLALVLEGLKPRAAFWAGGLTGLVHALTLVYWLPSTLGDFGGLPLVLALGVFLILAGILAVFPALFALGLSLARESPAVPFGSPAWIFLGAALFTGSEYLKRFVFTGFPWEPLGAALCPALPLIQLSDIFGVGGLTFFVATINLALAAFVHGMKKARPKELFSAVAVVLIAAAVLWGYGEFRLESVRKSLEASPGKTAAVIQGNIDQAIKWDPAYRTDAMVIYRDLTYEARAAHPWLIVWPETAAPFFFPQEGPASEWMVAVAKNNGTPILFGAPTYEDGRRRIYYNRANLLDGRGRLTGHYDKMHLVPFGEYIPFEEYFPFLGKVSDVLGNFSPGKKARLLPLGRERLGVLICYEAIFPSLARRRTAAGANWLAVITNDAWFGDAAAPYQHFSQTILRAVENRRTIIRAANTGISGIILPTGRIEAKLGMFKRGVLLGRTPEFHETTIYTVTGDVLPLICLGITALVFLAALARRKRHVGRSKTID